MRQLLLGSAFLVAATFAVPASAQYARDYGYNGGYSNSSTVRCESNDGRVNRCPLPYGGGRVVVERQLSRGACIEGRSWGQDRNAIWVSQGCRGEFVVRRGYRGGWNDSRYGYRGRVFRCESHDGRPRECAVNTRAGVQLVRQLSDSPCIQGRSWGYGRDGIWVSNGCRAEFRSY